MKKTMRLRVKSIPFILLAIIHIGLLLRFVNKKNNKKTWSLLFSNMGFAYIFEYIVLNLFQGYTYKPSILKQKYLDNILGALLSQGLYVPISATFLTVLQKNWKWRTAFSAIYFFIEHLFIKLNIYKTHWWKPTYTLFLIHVYYLISNLFYNKLLEKKNGPLG